MADAVRPTLGPLPRVVAFHQIVTNKMPEILDKGGVIARRIIQLPDRDADMGAMLTRELLWKLHKEYADGAATAAVLLQSIYSQGVTYLASGGNGMMLRRTLEEGLELILNELSKMTIQVEGKEQLARIAESVCQDGPLAEMLGEIFDIIGEYGQLEVRPLRSRELRREYVDGMYWHAKPFSRNMLTEAGNSRVLLEDAAILITDLEIEDAQQLIPAMQVALDAGFYTMLITATKLSTAALSVVMVNQDPQKLHAVAVRTPGSSRLEEEAAIEDLAVLAGGRPFRRAAGDTLSNVGVEDLGRARRVWVQAKRFGLAAGKGDPRAIREHMKQLKALYAATEDPDARRKLRGRIGALVGGAALLWAGGATEIEIETRKELAEQAAGSLRGALRDGVLPGGGVALLACRQILQERLDQSTGPDERAGYRILLNAMEAPARTIFENAGYESSQVMAQINHAGLGCGFDVVSGQMTNMTEAGICDVASVQKAAIGGAVTTAALALTVDVLVHHKKPEEVLTPE
jgi:chaperonin GroEL